MSVTKSHFFADGPFFQHLDVTKFHGDNGTFQNVTVVLKANPPVQSNFAWQMNGRKLSNSTTVTLFPDGLFFTPVLANVTGSYSVMDCNNISCANFTFSFVAYCKLWM